MLSLLLEEKPEIRMIQSVEEFHLETPSSVTQPYDLIKNSRSTDILFLIRDKDEYPQENAFYQRIFDEIEENKDTNNEIRGIDNDAKDLDSSVVDNSAELENSEPGKFSFDYYQSIYDVVNSAQIGLKKGHNSIELLSGNYTVTVYFEGVSDPIVLNGLCSGNETMTTLRSLISERLNLPIDNNRLWFRVGYSFKDSDEERVNTYLSSFSEREENVLLQDNDSNAKENTVRQFRAITSEFADSDESGWRLLRESSLVSVSEAAMMKTDIATSSLTSDDSKWLFHPDHYSNFREKSIVRSEGAIEVRRILILPFSNTFCF